MELTTLLVSASTVQVLQQEPLIPLVILAVVGLVVPILCKRLRFSSIIGLAIAGMILGPTGLSLLNPQLDSISSLGEIGLFYLVFLAGLELDLEKWHGVKSKGLRFSGLILGIGLAIGLLIGILWGWGVKVGFLVGLMFVPSTPIVYPILMGLGAASNRVVTAAIASKLATNAIVILLSTFCLDIHLHNLSLATSISHLGWLIVYATLILVGFDWAGREFFGRSGEDEGSQLLFVFVATFLAVVSAQWLEINSIFAAFAAGLGINNILCNGPVKQRLIVVGNFALIPIFIVYIGLLVNLPNFIVHIFNWRFLGFCLLISPVSKFLTAFSIKLLYRHNWRETLTLLSLLLPQINLTLAIAWAFSHHQLIPPSEAEIFDYAIAIMLISTWVAPIIARQVAGQLTTSTASQIPTIPGLPAADNTLPIIVVPTYNLQTQQHLIEMAALIGKQSKSRIVPLAIANAAANMDSPRLEKAIQRSQKLLDRAIAIASTLGANTEPRLRIDDALAPGISRAAKEENASLIILGWGKQHGLRSRLFGNVIDRVVWASHCPVAVTRLTESPSKIQRILVPIENISEPAIQPIQFAQLIAQINQAQVTLLNTCQRRTSSRNIDARRKQIAKLIEQLQLENPPEIQIIAHENITQAILQSARLYDLVVLPFCQEDALPGSMAISYINSQLASQLSCSVVMLGEPKLGNYVPLFALPVVNVTAKS